MCGSYDVSSGHGIPPALSPMALMVFGVAVVYRRRFFCVVFFAGGLTVLGGGFLTVLSVLGSR